jgi:transglutaminase-like putative cysteine protease
VGGVNRAAAFVLLALAGMVGWWNVLGPGLLWGLPLVACGGLVVARRIRPLAGAAALVLWVPLSLLLAGLPLHVLRPNGWGDVVDSLGEGLQLIGSAGGGRLFDEPWALAVGLLALGVLWMSAALLTTRGTLLPFAGLLVLLEPLIASVLYQSSPVNSAWHGAALLGAAVLWRSRGRLTLALPIAAVVSLVAVAGAQAFGPQDRWLRFDGSLPQAPFSRLDSDQTYGPLLDKRTGATMLEITSDEPQLWRMRVLEDWERRGWGMEDDQIQLPEPAAEKVITKVKVVGLRNRTIAAPGRVLSVDREVQDDRRGEGRRLTELPADGLTYTVTSQVVRATAAELATVKIPARGAYDHVTRLWPRRFYRSGDRLPVWIDDSPWGEAIKLSQRLAHGTDSQLEVVRRVEEYLTSGRYRYTTDVEQPGADPLLDFLFETHAGYCQHFAGAAALLLRLAGVPTRVVTGFATGKQTDADSYTVRDLDAHAWIEVYFTDYGWVSFNPTPAAADAEVADELDVLAPPDSAGVGSASGSIALVGGLGALLGAGAWFVRRRRRPALALGEVLAAIAGPVAPSVTLQGLRPRLAALGPSVAALADAAERARFAADGSSEPAYPRLLVWRALARDVGRARALRLLLRERFQHRAPDVLVDH